MENKNIENKIIKINDDIDTESINIDIIKTKTFTNKLNKIKHKTTTTNYEFPKETGGQIDPSLKELHEKEIEIERAALEKAKIALLLKKDIPIWTKHGLQKKYFEPEVINRTPIVPVGEGPSWEEVQKMNGILPNINPAPNLQASDITSTITDKILDILLGYNGDIIVNAQLASSLISATLSGISAIYTLAARETTLAYKIYLGVTLTANLSAFALSVCELFRKYGPTDAQITSSITKGVKIVADGILNPKKNDVQPNANIMNYTKYFLPVAKGLCAIAAMVVTGCDPEKLKTMERLSKIMDFTSKFNKQLDDGLDFVSSTLLGIDLTGDDLKIANIMELSQEAELLASTPVYKFLADGSLNSKLHTFHDRAIKEINLHNKTKSLGVRTALGSLSNNLRIMTELKKSIAAVSDLKQRQETLAIMFCGRPGLGKSTFAKLFLKRIATRFGYQTDIYSLNKPDGFYLPYKGQDLAILDEFANTNDGDPNAPYFNMMFSSDPFNFEAAQLEYKFANSQLKLAGITCNELSPQLKNMKSDSVKAMWSRTIRVVVEDPQYIDRSTDHKHRREDCSHLRLKYSLSDNPHLKEVDMTDISHDQLFSLICAQVAKRERDYINLLDPSLPASDRQMTDLRKAFLNNISPRANAAGQKFFMIRIQGKAGNGKTTLARHISDCFTELLVQLKTVVVEDFDTIYEGNNIYIIDDLIVKSNNRYSYDMYVKWLNKQQVKNPLGIFILIENKKYEKVEYKRDSWFDYLKFEKCYNVTGIAEIEGIARRLGLTGIVRFESNYIYNSPEVNTCITSTNTDWYIEDQAYLQNDIVNIIYDKYKEFVLSRKEVLVEYTTILPSKTDFDLEVRQPTLEQLLKDFSSIGRMMAAINSRFFVKQHIINDLHKVTNYKDWIVTTRVQTFDHVLEVAKKMYSAILNMSPELSFRLVVSDLELTIIGIKGIMHVLKGQSTPAFKCSYDLGGNIDLYEYDLLKPNTTPVFLRKIVKEDLATFISDGFLGGVKDNSFDQLNFVSDFYQKTKENHKGAVFLNNLIAKRLWKKKVMEFLSTGAFRKMREHPVLTAIGAAVTLLGTGLAVYGIYNYMTLPTDTDIMKNSDENEESLEKIKKARQVRNRFKLAGKYNDDRFLEYLDKVGIRDAYISREREEAIGFKQHGGKHIRNEYGDVKPVGVWQPKWHLQPNTKAVMCSVIPDMELGIITPEEAMKKAMALNNDYDIQILLHRRPDLYTHMTKLTSNMLTLKEVQWQTDTPLITFIKSYESNYVKVSSDIGRCYGLGFKERLLITVSHLIENLDSQVIVSSNGQSYIGKVKGILRERDIAIIEIVDNTFPQFKDISKKFSTSEECIRSVRSYYVRPDPGRIVVAGELEYSARLIAPLGYESLFKPDSELIRLTFLQVPDITNCVKDGDCGLPLVICTQNGFKIAGIHNAFSNSTAAMWFSHVSRDDTYVCNNVIKNSLEDKITVHHPQGGDMIIDEFYYNNMLDMKVSKYEGLSDLSMLGYAPTLKTFSNPQLKKKKLHALEGKYKTQCLTTSAAIKYETFMEKTDLIPDRRGHIYPLFTQAVKFTKCTSTFGNFDNETFYDVLEVIQQRWDEHYPNRGRINIKKCLNGLPDNSILAFDPKTSAGPKMKLKYGIPTKEGILVNKSKIGDKPYYEFSDNEAGQECYKDALTLIKQFEKGEKVIMVARDNPKVELLPIEKVKKGKVRLFNELDFSANVALKYFFGDTLSKVNKIHETTPYKVGFNPYLEATRIQMAFDLIDGELISLDVSALDKSIPPILIRAFVSVALSHESDETQIAISNFLSNSLHIMDGNLYFIGRGNESGSYVTTLLNCFVMETILLYTLNMSFNEIGVPFTLRNIQKYTQYCILGDDVTAKLNKMIPVDLEEITKVGAFFNINITPAKVESSSISFCSREYVKDEKSLVVYPALKKSSVISALHWFNEIDKDTIIQNLNGCLFEAAFHSQEFFNDVVHDANLISTYIKARNRLDSLSYKQYRQHFIEYVKGEQKTPSFMVLDNQIESNSKTESLNNLKIKMNKSLVNEYYMLTKGSMPKIEYIKEGLDHTPLFKAKMEVNGCTYNAYSATKKGSEEKVFGLYAKALLAQYGRENNTNFSTMRDLLQYLRPKPNADNEGFEKLTLVDEEYENMKIFILASLERQLSIFNDIKQDVYLLLNKEVYELPRQVKLIDKYRVEFFEKDEKEHMCLLGAALQAVKYKYAEEWLTEVCIKMKIVITSDSNGIFALAEGIKPNCAKVKQVKVIDVPLAAYELYRKKNIGKDNVTPNMEKNQPVGPSEANQAMNAQSAMTIPMRESAQVVGINPAMTAPSQDIMGIIEPTVNHQDLNPIGVPHMLNAGAIGFDLKDIIYTDMLDQGNMVSITNTGTEGTIIAQIPYDPLSTYMNPYIKQWVKMHERYEGAIMVRVTMIGNPMYSSAIGVSWMPSKVTTGTINMTEAMKYSYRMYGTTMPANETYLLHDARKDSFYRTTDETNIDSRPHLVIYLGMSIQNPFNEAAIIRFRIATKLAGPQDTPNFFKVSNPIIPLPASLGVNTGLLGGNFKLFFKQTYQEQMFIYTDGTVLNNQSLDRDLKYYNFSTSGNQVMPYIGNLDFTTGGPESVPTGGAPVPMYFIFNKTEAKPFEDWLDDDNPCGSISFTFYVSPTFNVYDYMTVWWKMQSDFNNPLVTTAEQIETLMLEQLPKLTTDRMKIQAIWRYIAPDGQGWGGYKVITNQGIIYISFNRHSKSDAGKPYPEYSFRNKDTANNWFGLNYDNIDSVLLYTNPDELVQLGPNNAVLRFTSIQPSTNPTGANCPTARDDNIILSYCKSVGSTLQSGEFLRLYVSDVLTNNILFVAQYNVAANSFVINQTASVTDFSVMPQSIETLNIDMRIENGSVTLPYTNNQNWLPRTPITRKANEFKSIPEPVKFRPMETKKKYPDGYFLTPSAFKNKPKPLTSEQRAYFQKLADEKPDPMILKWLREDNEIKRIASLRKPMPRSDRIALEHVIKAYPEDQELQQILKEDDENIVYQSRKKLIEEVGKVTPNATAAAIGAATSNGLPFLNIIGGALAGAGNGMQQNAQNAWQSNEKQKERDFYGEQNAMYRDFTKELNETNWTHRNAMQGRDFTHQRQMQQADFKNAAYLSGVRTPMRNVVGASYGGSNA